MSDQLYALGRRDNVSCSFETCPAKRSATACGTDHNPRHKPPSSPQNWSTGSSSSQTLEAPQQSLVARMPGEALRGHGTAAHFKLCVCDTGSVLQRACAPNHHQGISHVPNERFRTRETWQPFIEKKKKNPWNMTAAIWRAVTTHVVLRWSQNVLDEMRLHWPNAQQQRLGE